MQGGLFKRRVSHGLPGVGRELTQGRNELSLRLRTDADRHHGGLLVIVDDDERDPCRPGLVGLARDADGLAASHDFLALGEGGDGHPCRQ